jgi:hypothetical protein
MVIRTHIIKKLANANEDDRQNTTHQTTDDRQNGGAEHQLRAQKTSRRTFKQSRCGHTLQLVADTARAHHEVWQMNRRCCTDIDGSLSAVVAKRIDVLTYCDGFSATTIRRRQMNWFI